MSEKVIKTQNKKKNVLDYGMEWFDYHMTAGLYISMAIAALLFIFVFVGRYYRGEVSAHFPAISLLETIMWIYYLVYALLLFVTRKLFLAEDRRSFYLSLLMFAVRAVFHGFVIFYLLVLTPGITTLENSIFYTYIFYFSNLTTAINIINIFYFIKRRHIFDYAE